VAVAHLVWRRVEGRLSLREFLARIAESLDAAQIPFMLTGSLAAAYYGTPRATQDIDLVIDPGQAQLDRLLDLLAGGGLYVSRDAAAEAFQQGGQFNAIDPGTGWKADLIIRKTREFSRIEFGRRKTTSLLGVEVALTTIEDLIIAKLEWSEMGDSELQRRDIVGLIDASGPALDRDYLQNWIAALGLERAWQKLERGRAEG
jgi:hypothetical protein